MAKITHSRECFPKRSSRYGPIPSLHRQTVQVVALNSQGGWAGPACCGSACAGESRWAYLPASPTWTGSRPNIRSAHRRGPCLLYTSDAADDLTRVDLGGRRIIKKKKQKKKKTGMII